MRLVVVWGSKRSPLDAVYTYSTPCEMTCLRDSTLAREIVSCFQLGPVLGAPIPMFQYTVLVSV